VTDPHEVVAAEYGLSREAAKFLQDETVEELEESATALADLLGRSGHQVPDDAPALDPITAGLRAKAERKAELHALFTGREPPQRDERGRYASTGFDGGARRTVRQRDPEREHGELLGMMTSLSRTFGRSFCRDSSPG
jgi:hypothetical protein